MNLNMTEEHLEKVVKALPDEMEDAELCALTLTIYSIYRDNPAEIVTQLVDNIYTFAASQGMDSSRVSAGLRATADVYDKQQAKH
jgi:hypothetical protein